jgi:hypothetical protein
LRIEATRRRNAERVQRIMVQKVAPVAHDVLAAQIAEKELRLQAEKEADRAWADSQASIVHYMKTIECNEMASKEARNRALREEWDAQLRAKAEEAAEKAKTVTPSLLPNDIQGPSSMQNFKGADLQLAARKRLQGLQMKYWADEQLKEKEALKAKAREEEARFSQSLIALEQTRNQIAEEEAAQRKARNKQFAQYNAALALQKSSKGSEASDPSMLSFQLTTEDSKHSALGAHRHRKDHYTGMSKAEELNIRKEQQEQIKAKEEEKKVRELEKQNYANEVKEIQRITTEFERLEMESKALRAAELKVALNLQKEQAKAREAKSKIDSINSISPGFYSKFGTSAR